MIGQFQQGLSLLVAQHMGRDGLLVGIVVRNVSILGMCCIFWSLHLNHLAHKCRYVVGLREYQHHFHVAVLCQYQQQFLQLVARLGIQSDEGIIHDQQLRTGKQGLGQLKLPQLTTRQGDDILVQQTLHVEQLIQVFLQLPSLFSVLTCQQIGTFR